MLELLWTNVDFTILATGASLLLALVFSSVQCVALFKRKS